MTSVQTHKTWKTRSDKSEYKKIKKRRERERAGGGGGGGGGVKRER